MIFILEQKDFLIHNCPLCDSERIEYKFVAHGRVITECLECGHLFSNPQRENLDANNLIKPLYSQDDFKKFIKFYTNSDNPFCVDNLDIVKSPADLLKDTREKMKDGDSLFLFVPTLDSRNAKRQRQKWTAFEQERLHFFSFKTLNNILCKIGFGEIEFVNAGENGLFVRAVKMPKNNTVSFIIPVYNEKSTVLELLNTVYKKDISHLGLNKEIIIIESNSTDGTKEIVQKFVNDHQEIKLILEDKPQGKGHAVRNGFKVATGDFIAIQDGDLEYDINDYDKLLPPLVKYQEAFILGSRHSGNWQMRKFGDGEKFLAAFLNLGQIIFTSLINFGCGVRLKDPFTMFKLFRRECLYGLEFDGNRFEIDWEILIKLIRKGYIPFEIPVNFLSRGFSQGKKVKIFKDPILWIINFIRYRYFYKIHTTGGKNIQHDSK